MIINFLGSVDIYAPRNSEAETFQRFLRLEKNEDILVFYLFMRAVI
jgi:hypothetical protein